MKRLTILAMEGILLFSFPGLNLAAENKKTDLSLNFGATIGLRF